MGDFGFEGPSNADIWAKITSDDVSEKLEGLLDAARTKAMIENDIPGSLTYLEAARDLADLENDFTSLTRIYLLLGMTHSQMGKYQLMLAAHSAGADIARTALLSDVEVEHLMAMGRAYRRLEDFEGMRTSFDLAIKLGAECGHYYLNTFKAEYGRYLRKLGDLDGARALLESAAGSDSGPYPASRASTELVRVMLAAGDSVGALARAQEAYSAASYMNDPRLMNSSQYLYAKALVANGDFATAIKELNDLSQRQKFAKVRHKVRIDLLMAEAMIGEEDCAGAAVLLNKAIPMLRRDSLFVELGDAYMLRSKCEMATYDTGACANSLLAAVDAFSSGSELERMCAALLELAEWAVMAEDWDAVKGYAGRIVDQVLMSFTTVHNEALGLTAIALAKEGSLDEAAVLVGRLGEIKGLTGSPLAHLLYAQTLLATGVRQRNLAAKAVKEYLLLKGNFFITDLVPLM